MGDDYAAKYIADATAAHPPLAITRKTRKVDRGRIQTRHQRRVHLGLETGTRDHPIPLPSGYETNAAKVAQQRIAIAGYRLAAVLNEKLK